MSVNHPATHISDHLLVYLTLSFLTGIALASQLHPLADSLFGVAVSLLAGLILLAVLHARGKRNTVLCLLPLLLTACGYYHAQVALQMPTSPDHIFQRIQEKTEAVIVGTLATAVQFDGKTSRMMISIEYLRYRETADLLPTTGNIVLYMEGTIPATLLPGDQVAVRADLKRPNSFQSPGAFDHAQHLASSNIWITGFIRSPLFLQELAKEQGMMHSLFYLPEKLRTRIGERIDTAVAPENQGLYRAILIGDRSLVDDTILETFKGSGTFHILAISGLHMTIIGTILYTTIYWLLSRSPRLLFRYPLKKWSAFLCLPALLGYGLLAGLNTPVFRAVIMSCVVIVAICTDRPKSPSALLASAALIILAVDPLALFGASFQLSFMATMAILFLFPLVKKRIIPTTEDQTKTVRQKTRDWLIAGLLVSTVATMVTAPITISAFNRFSPMGILANILVEPLICLWSLPCGFISIPLLFIYPELSSWLLQLGALGLSGAVQITTFFSDLPLSTFWLPPPPLWVIAGYYTGLLGCAFWEKVPQYWLWPPALLLTTCFILQIYPQALSKKNPTDSFLLSFLDVGQGSATLLEFPSGQTVLIDGGGSSSATASSVGERVIAPYLWHRGITTLDAVIITHPDADHYNGLAFILKHFSPQQLWIRDEQGHDGQFQQLLHLADEMEVTVVSPDRGMRMAGIPQPASIECLENLTSENNSMPGNMLLDQKNSGIIIKACSGPYCALFPGDIGRSEERLLVDQGYDLKADILLAPHHGSITSNSMDFLSATAPALMIVSAGNNSRGYFPHNRLQDDCERQGITLLTTSQQGTLVLSLSDKEQYLNGYAKEHNNPLHPYKPVQLGPFVKKP